MGVFGDYQKQGGLTRRKALVLGAAGLTVFGATGLRAADMKPGETGRVIRVIDGDSFVLEDGLIIRLAGIEAPRTALKSKKREAWPFAGESRAALSGLINKREVQLFYGGESRDRYGRAVAQVYTIAANGQRDIWIQAEMVRLGLARVMPWPGEYADIAALYALEAEAREKGRGIWSDPFYAPRSPDPNALAQFVDSVQIVEGIITSVADVRGQIYLNFGADYRTDFTVAIAKKNVKRFTAGNIDPLALEGAKVRVRGWVELINGPMIWLNQPERLEILS
ncbi:thermonuclease family protein [Litorimonas sp. RW-G-Af-16]|uniref:thermonuclease family protein n=1 Tax=Litorimonas sp. RW-G-Af-16 TaxID=3241168 RepID=UPI00390C925D